MRWFKWMFLLCCMLIANIIVEAQEKYVLKIHFEPKNTVTKKLHYKSKFNDSLLLMNEVEDILVLLQKQGYLLPEIDTLKKTEYFCELKIVIGSVFKWINLHTDSADRNLIANIHGSVPDFSMKPFNIEKYTAFRKKIIYYLENHGFPFASLELKDIQLTDSTLQGLLHIDKGPKFIMDSIKMWGELELAESYLRNYLSIKEGENYNESKINKIDKRLEELPFLILKDPTAIAFKENSVDVNIYADNKNASRFDGILGFLPDNNKPGKILITGDAKLNLINSLGRGENLFLRWRKLMAETQDLKLNVNYPYIFNTVIGADLGLYMFKKDTTYLNLNRSIGLRYHFVGNDYLKLYYELQTTDILSTYGLENIAQIPPYLDVKTDIYGLEYKYDHLDYLFNPRKGLDALANISVGQKKIKKNMNANQTIYEELQLKTTKYNIKADLSYYIPLWRFNTIQLANKSGAIFNDELLENELFRIGGLNTLRGFDEESVYASHYSIFTFEFRYLFERMSHLKVFYRLCIL